MKSTLLQIRDLAVEAPRVNGGVRLVDAVSLEVRSGEILGLVGESGCGKSLTACAVLDILPHPLRVSQGTIIYGGEPILQDAGPSSARRLRGRQVTAIFQEPGAALNPVQSIGSHLQEVFVRSRGRNLPFGRDQIALLRRVQIPSPRRVLRCYPHELSGGMKQRIMIAMAIAPGPELIIADEPTTALDPTTRVQITELLRDLTAETGMALLLISHDLATLQTVSDRIAVMYAGRVVEVGPTGRIMHSSLHPYTRGLLACHPSRIAIGTRLPTIEGSVPAPERRPSGCAFRDRCSMAMETCAQSRPEMLSVAEGHWAACPVAASRRTS